MKEEWLTIEKLREIEDYIRKYKVKVNKYEVGQKVKLKPFSKCTTAFDSLLISTMTNPKIVDTFGKTFVIIECFMPMWYIFDGVNAIYHEDWIEEIEKEK